MLTPISVYSVFRSSLNMDSSYPRVSVISKTPQPAVWAAAGQRLLAGTADTHQERVALVQTDDSMDPGEVLERILEEYQVHRLV